MNRIDPDTLALVASFVRRATQAREHLLRERMRHELLVIIIPRALDYYRSGPLWRRIWRAIRG